MSRHRDVRCMNYTEEYEGYDDVYGHSVEDDYCVSPSAEQFLFDRSKQQNIASFITEPDIIEDNEDNEERTISFNEEDTSTVNKDNPKFHPDLTSTILQSSSFTIPKLSFNKQEDIKGSDENVWHINNLEDFKNLSINNSSMKVSPLSEFTTNSVNCTLSNSKMEYSKNNVDKVSFKSLADLTAHHLQKSSNSIGSTSSNGKTSLPKTNFIIPKLSNKKDNYIDLNNTQLNLSSTQNIVNLDCDILNDRETDDSMDSLEKSLFSVFASSKQDIDISTKNNSQNIEPKEDPVLNLSNTRTPSPDPWIIDLTSTLKQVISLTSDNCSYMKSKVSEDVNNVISNSSLQSSNTNIEIPYVRFPTISNLCYLRYVKLSHTKKNVSLFGRTLCRTWKLKKSILKPQKKDHQIIKRFDFSVPYVSTLKVRNNNKNF